MPASMPPGPMRTLMLALVGNVFAWTGCSGRTQRTPGPPPIPTAEDLADPLDAAPQDDGDAEALACGDDNIRRYNAGAVRDGPETLLLAAADCYRAAGELGHALRALRAVAERHPTSARRAESLAHARAIFGLIMDEDGAAGSPHGRRCVEAVDLTTLEAEPAIELERAAQCLYDHSLIGSALVLRNELDRRSLSEEHRSSNAYWIFKYERALEGLARYRDAAEAGARPPP